MSDLYLFVSRVFCSTFCRMPICHPANSPTPTQPAKWLPVTFRLFMIGERERRFLPEYSREAQKTLTLAFFSLIDSNRIQCPLQTSHMARGWGPSLLRLEHCIPLLVHGWSYSPKHRGDVDNRAYIR